MCSSSFQNTLHTQTPVNGSERQGSQLGKVLPIPVQSDKIALAVGGKDVWVQGGIDLSFGVHQILDSHNVVLQEAALHGNGDRVPPSMTNEDAECLEVGCTRLGNLDSRFGGVAHLNVCLGHDEASDDRPRGAGGRKNDRQHGVCDADILSLYSFSLGSRNSRGQAGSLPFPLFPFPFLRLPTS